MIIKTVHDANTEELLTIMRAFDIKAKTVEDVLACRREMFEALAFSVKKAQRFLAHAAGEKVEPEVHYGDVVLRPAGGMAG